MSKENLYFVSKVRSEKNNLLFSTRVMPDVLSGIMSRYCQNGRVSGLL